MTLDQINEFINKGGAALALSAILFILTYLVFGREKNLNRKSRK